MTEEKIYAELTEIFQDVFDDDDIELVPETSANDIEGWDSLANINIIVSIENAFDIKFDMTQIPNMKCVKDIVDKIQEALSE